ncbi:MAG: PqqD family protein [Pyrinomonadaceae bacterium]|nr:PqqD family protein [Pyrinomonadaceae bacterium]
MSEIYPVSRKADIVVQDFKDETLVFDLIKNKAFVLNETSSMVWQLCDGKNSIDEITNKMSASINQTVSVELVWLAVEELNRENLIENNSFQITPFFGLSRREMVRKIGFASIITLPLISVLVAPTAINAASGCFPVTNNANENPNGCPCDSNSDCLTVCCGVSAGAEVCVNLRATPVCQPCRGNCECPPTYTCPSIAGRPRICRPNGVPVPPLPAPDNCL